MLSVFAVREEDHGADEDPAGESLTDQGSEALSGDEAEPSG